MGPIRNCVTCAAPDAARCANCSAKEGWTNWVPKVIPKVTSCGCGTRQSAEEDRIDVIGANGNTGKHYGVDAGPLGGGDIYASDETFAMPGPECPDDIRATSPTTAPQLLKKAASLMEERARQYDSPGGERSMGKAVAAFNAITGRNLTEPEGWSLLQVLKDVRQWQKPGYHADSAEDCIAYAALKAEALGRAP